MGFFDFLFSKKQEVFQPTNPALQLGVRQRLVITAEAPQEMPEDTIYQEAFAKTTHTITAPQDALQGLFCDHRVALFLGSPRDCDKAAVDYLAGSGWTWGEFDRWNEEFSRRTMWPYMWSALKGEALEGWQVRRKEKAKCALLSHTITMSFYVLRNYYQHRAFIEARGRSFDVNRDMRVSAIDGCQIEAEFSQRFNVGKTVDLPPFFPGDRSDLQPKLDM